MHELRQDPEPQLPKLLQKLSRVDLVVVEGFKSGPHRKIEVHRAANGKPFLFPEDAAIAGIATDAAGNTVGFTPIGQVNGASVLTLAEKGVAAPPKT